ncbi:hypothetical protein S40288_11709 [Stachybotrys chartarum IBT 40288]|nr:hypothetical protein S40288_11709 [Stachybotrys chartarum IBT 40288]
MACSFPPDDAAEAIKNTGAYLVEDASTGNSVMAFRRRLPFRTPEGLDFCSQNSLLNMSIRNVIESSIDHPRWGLAKIYSGDVLSSEHAYFFFDGPDMQVILVLLWSPKSRFLIFEGSHTQKIDGKEMSEFGILTLPRAEMRKKGITEAPVEMAHGGFALIDGRVGWTILEGYQIAIGYASEAEISHWGKIELVESEALRAKVAELNARGIRTNFVFIEASPLRR